MARRIRMRGGLIACTIVVAAAAASQANVVLTPIALTGTDGPLGPGLGPGIVFDHTSSLTATRINDSREVAFTVGRLLSGGSPVDPESSGAWRAAPGVPPVAAAVQRMTGPLGPNIPAFPDAVFGSTLLSGGFGIGRLNNGGELVLSGGLVEGGIGGFTDAGAFRVPAGAAPSPIAQLGVLGDLGPNIGSNPSFDVFQGLGGMSINDTGTTMLHGVAFPTSAPRSGFWQHTAGTSGLTNLVLTGTDGPEGPGLGAGVEFKRGGFPAGLAATLNDMGDYAFSAEVTGAGITSSNEDGAWLGRAGGPPTAVAREGVTGALGPSGGGLDPGVVFGNFGSFVNLNDAADVTFTAALSGPGITGSSNTGLFQAPAGTTPRIVARHGVSGALGPNIPGQQNALFQSLFNRLIWLNASGDMAFHAGVSGAGGPTTGIWSVTGGAAPDPVVLNGTDGPLGPGLGPGITFQSFYGTGFNAAGDIAFLAELGGTGVFRDQALYVASGGGLTQIVRKGDVVDVDPGPGSDLRTVNGIIFPESPGNQNGLASAFNESGHLSFVLGFTDSHEAVVVAVPEPNALVILAGALTSLLARRRRV